MKEIIKYCKDWNRWIKQNLNSKFHKIMVLFGLRRSPTLEQTTKNHMDSFKNLVVSFDEANEAIHDLNKKMAEHLKKNDTKQS